MPVFCCTSRKPYRPIRTDEEDKFRAFLQWADGIGSYSVPGGQDYVIQAVKQINFGPVEQITYFRRSPTGFQEVDEDFVIQGNLSKTNSYKNFKCDAHNKFFEINLYGRCSVSKHHWRASQPD